MLKTHYIFLSLLLSSNAVFCQTSEPADAADEKIKTDTVGAGLIIELDTKVDETPPADNNAQKVRPIQMIVGGQGKDGVAKQGTLPIDD